VAIRGEAVCDVAGVPGPQSATAIAQSAPEDAWASVTWGTGTAGPLTARFCALRVRPTKGRGDRWLLCERSATDERKYYLVHLPETAALVDLVALARSRWPIEQQYRELKDELGLDHFEGRTFQGWAHHVVLTAVAFTFFQIERGRVAVEARPTLPVVRGWVREILGLLYVIHNRRLLSMLDSFRRNRRYEGEKEDYAPRVDHHPRRFLLDPERDLRVRCDADRPFPKRDGLPLFHRAALHPRGVPHRPVERRLRHSPHSERLPAHTGPRASAAALTPC